MPSHSFTRTDYARQNIQALLDLHQVNQTRVSLACGHERSWLNKILIGSRGLPLDDLDDIARYFKVEPWHLIQPGAVMDRRSGLDRRVNTRDRRRDHAHTTARAKASRDKAHDEETLVYTQAFERGVDRQAEQGHADGVEGPDERHSAAPDAVPQPRYGAPGSARHHRRARAPR